MIVCVIKGTILCRRFPFKVRRSSKGYHVVWRHLNIDERTMFKYRMVLGDDPNRISLDMEAGKRQKQVLFSEKTVIYYGYLFSKWLPERVFKSLSPSGEWIKICPLCKQRIYKSVKVWNGKKSSISIYHNGNNKVCEMPIRIIT